MSKSLLSTVLKLAFAGSATVMQVSSYTFDPMNNSWKPSVGQHRRHHHTSSSASSYSASSYAPTAEPIPSSVGVEFAYNEDDIVRHHYAGWGSDHQVEIDTLDPAFLGKESVVQIEYNKKTGDVTLQDQDGIVTKEEYERLMKEIKSSYSDEGGAVTDEEADGTTHFLDTEELDLTDIIDTQVIDTQGEELDLTDTIDTQVIDTQVIDTEVEVLPMKELTVTATAPQELTVTATAPQEEQEQHHQYQYQYQPQPQHQEYSQPEPEHQEYSQPDPQYAQYHYSESVSSEEYPQTQPQPQYAQYHHSESVSTESFNTFSIPQPPIEINHPIPQHPAYPVAEEQAYAHHYHQPHIPQPVYAQAQAVAVAIAEPVMASGQQYYQTQPSAQAVMEPPPAVQYQQHHQYQEQSVASYSTTSVASSATTNVVEQDAEEYGIPEGGYRSSRGFGFVHRRNTFVYNEENNF